MVAPLNLKPRKHFSAPSFIGRECSISLPNFYPFDRPGQWVRRKRFLGLLTAIHAALSLSEQILEETTPFLSVLETITLPTEWRPLGRHPTTPNV